MGLAVAYTTGEVVAHGVLIVYGPKAIIELASSGSSEKPPRPDPSQIHDPNQFHYDRQHGGPGQLEHQYSETEFEHTPRGARGPDVEVVGGKHPSDYPGSTWEPGNDYGDFKPNTESGWRRFWGEIIGGKLPLNTQPLPYDPDTYEIKPDHKFGPR